MKKLNLFFTSMSCLLIISCSSNNEIVEETNVSGTLTKIIKRTYADINSNGNFFLETEFQIENNRFSTIRETKFNSDNSIQHKKTTYFTYQNNLLLNYEITNEITGELKERYDFIYDSNNNLIENFQYIPNLSAVGFDYQKKTYIFNNNTVTIKFYVSHDNGQSYLRLDNYTIYLTFNSNNNLTYSEYQTTDPSGENRFYTFIYNTNNNIIEEENYDGIITNFSYSNYTNPFRMLNFNSFSGIENFNLINHYYLNFQFDYNKNISPNLISSVIDNTNNEYNISFDISSNNFLLNFETSTTYINNSISKTEYEFIY